MGGTRLCVGRWASRGGCQRRVRAEAGMKYSRARKRARRRGRRGGRWDAERGVVRGGRRERYIADTALRCLPLGVSGLANGKRDRTVAGTAAHPLAQLAARSHPSHLLANQRPQCETILHVLSYTPLSTVHYSFSLQSGRRRACVCVRRLAPIRAGPIA